MKVKSYILVPCFLLFIAFPLLNGLTGIVPDIPGTENRKQRSFGELKMDVSDSGIKQIESYFTDRISGRNRMIQWYNHLNVFVFRSSPISIKAIVGKDGWYFMSGQELRTFSGTELFKEQELIDFKNELLLRKQFVESHGAGFFFAIVPNKPNVYPEYMPDHIIKANDKGYGRQLLEYLEKNGIPVIDLYTPLLEAKPAGELYYRTDNHWNDLGAFVASNAILTEIHNMFPKVMPLDTGDYPVKKIEDKPGNIARFFSIENEVTEYNYIPIPRRGFKTKEEKLSAYPAPEDFPYADQFSLIRSTGDEELPVILIIRDSFGEKPFPYIAEQSRRCIAIYDAWHYGLNPEIIKGEKPDVVLYLVIESNLKDLMKYAKK